MRTVHYVMISLLVMCCLEWSFAGVAAEYDPDVYEAQKRLQEHGYDPGPIDGLMGKKTTAAIKTFQKDQGLPITGILDKETKEKLGLHTAGSAPLSEPSIRCAFAGTGATLSFGDKRLNFTCPAENGNDVGLLGEINSTEKGWEIEKAVIGHTDKGFVCINEEGEKVIDYDLYVSMNQMGFTYDVFDRLDQFFIDFLEASGQDLKSESFLPSFVNELIEKKLFKVKVHPTQSRWFGVTYKEDKPVVEEKINELVAQGKYPEKLW